MHSTPESDEHVIRNYTGRQNTLGIAYDYEKFLPIVEDKKQTLAVTLASLLL
jgi:hypothetical protein